MVRTLFSDVCLFFFSSRRRHTRFDCDWSSDVCSSDLLALITDIFMPGQDGIVTVRRIRKESPGLKVIDVSGGDSTGRLDHRKDAQPLRADTSLRKPLSSAELLRAVRDVVGLGSDPPPRK